MKEQICPKCGSDDIEYEGQFNKANLEYQDDKLMAIMLQKDSDINMDIYCNSCQAHLIPTQEGFRLE